MVFAADASSLIRYQGNLSNNVGEPLNEPVTLTFRLYTDETAPDPDCSDTTGTCVWEEPQASVPVTNGQFSVLLGEVTSLEGVDWDQKLWLGITVNSDSEMTPRQEITSVPTALFAQTAESLGGWRDHNRRG